MLMSSRQSTAMYIYDETEDVHDLTSHFCVIILLITLLPSQLQIYSHSCTLN